MSLGEINLNKHLRLEKNKPLTKIWSSGTPALPMLYIKTRRVSNRKYLEVTLKLKKSDKKFKPE